MNKTICICIAFIFSFQLYSQYPLKVGNDNAFGDHLPYDNRYDYNWCTALYPQNKINAHGSIVKLYYLLSIWETAGFTAHNQKVYMAHTADVEFTDAGYPNPAAMTLVYQCDISYMNYFNHNTYTEINLTTPFEYNNSDNLVIHIENHHGSKIYVYHDNMGIYSETYSRNMCKFNAQDGSFPATNGTLITRLPIAYLGFGSGLDVGVNTFNEGVNELLPGIHDISFNFRNYMGDTINSCAIHAELNGVPLAPINWSGVLYTGQESDTMKLLTNYDFAPGTYQFKVWTANPNGGTDENNTNDTIVSTIAVADFIEIADESYTGNNVFEIPYRSGSLQGWSGVIVNKDSIKAGRKICGIAFQVVSNGYERVNQSIFFDHTDNDYFQDLSMPDETGMTKMFSGNIDYTGTEWRKIAFDSLFDFNDADNLMIYYTNKSRAYNTPLTEFKASSYGANVGVYNYTTSGNEFPTGNGTLSQRIPNIRLYILIPDDAGISSLDAPATYFNTDANDIKVTLKNYGTENLESVNFFYQIDEGDVHSYSWSGSLSCYETEKDIVIGSGNFTYGPHTLKVWTDSPNGLNDYKNENDTLVKNIYATNPLCGNYVVGNAPSDFTTLRAAVDSLNSCGIACDVVFDVKPGTYPSQYIINEINDAGQNSTVTIRSQSGSSADVVITSDSTDFVLYLNGADNIHLEHLTIKSDSAPVLMKLGNGASNNRFYANVFNGAENTTYAVYSPQEASSNDDANSIEDNLFTGGSYAIDLNSDGSAYETDNMIISNIFQGQTTESIRLSRQNGYVISGNQIFGTTYISSCQRGLFEKNRIAVDNMFQEPLVFLGNNDTTLVLNNFIKSDNVNSGAVRLSGSNIAFLHNTVVCSKNWDGLGVLNIYNDHVSIYNNIIASKSYGSAIYVSQFASDIYMDYNCLYNTEGNPVGVWNNTLCMSLDEWQAESGLDAGSISLLPVFASDTDFHTNTMALDGAGIPLSRVQDDIDGEQRDPANPDIGADEFTSTCKGMLKGTYTIGVTGDFSTFGEAVTALLECGISGSVTFNAQPGTYSEQIIIRDAIPHYTKGDTILFQSQTADSTSVVLTWQADSLNNYTVKIDGADRIIFKQLTIQSAGSQYGRVLEIGNGSCNNLIENCIIHGIATGNDNSSQALIYFTESTSCRDTSNTIRGNRLINGSYGITLNGNQTRQSTFNHIASNSFINQASYGIYADHQMNLIIEKNRFENDYETDVEFYGILNVYSDSAKIVKNVFDLQRNSRINAVSLHNYQNDNLIANNFISVNSGTSAYGIINAGHNTKIYYNSIYIHGKSGSVAADLTYSTKNADVRNNIFANNAGGLALRCYYDGTQISQSENNNLFSNGPHIAHWLGTDLKDLPEWQAATGFDNQSVSSYPNFVSDSDLHTSNVLLNNAASLLPEIADDIDGEPRDAVTPDIGADEFTGEPVFSLGDDVTVCLYSEHKIDAGTGFDTYLWSTGETTSYILVDSTGTGSGFKTYSVAVTLAAVEFSDSVTITFANPVAAPVTDYCFNENADSIKLTAGEGLSYLWSTGERTQSVYISSGSWYGVTVTDVNGCKDEGSIHIHHNFCVADMGMPVETVISENESLVLQANQCSENYGAYDYIWSTGETTFNITLRGSELGTGTHQVVVNVINKVVNNCQSSDTCVIVVGSGSYLNEISDGTIMIYPSPAEEVIFVEFEPAAINKKKKVSVLNTEGMKLIEGYTDDNQMRISLKGLQPGLYLILVKYDNVTRYSRFIIQ
ncbi:MAG: T9SS type A sorting domain-containing protein [Bacteroidales bacterium]|nr:T9SS type A sorting domain-containing protein [Bacteroidales bacterium]